MHCSLPKARLFTHRAPHFAQLSLPLSIQGPLDSPAKPRLLAVPRPRVTAQHAPVNLLSARAWSPQAHRLRPAQRRQHAGHTPTSMTASSMVTSNVALPLGLPKTFREIRTKLVLLATTPTLPTNSIKSDLSLQPQTRTRQVLAKF